jgi:hypothetical protein
MHIAAHEVDDVSDHGVVLLKVVPVRVQSPIRIKGDQLQGVCAGVHLGMEQWQQAIRIVFKIGGGQLKDVEGNTYPSHLGTCKLLLPGTCNMPSAASHYRRVFLSKAY